MMQANGTHLAGLGPDVQYTDHAMLVPWGHFAQQFGLVDVLMKVPLPQKTVEHAPQTKLLQQFSQPFIDRELLPAIRQEERLCYDADLTGREVSATCRDYPGAAFGWMGDHVGLGYQAAVVSMGSPTYGRILLSGQHHAGDTVATECLQAPAYAGVAAEAATGV